MTDPALPPASAIADVLALWRRDGWLTPPLRTVVAPAITISGGVRIVVLEHGTTGPGMSPIYDVLSADLTGRFVLLAGARTVPGAVWGEILCTAARSCGAAGVLIDGAVRDRQAITDIGLPTFAAAEEVVGPNGLAHVVAIDEPVVIDGVGVAPDDHIVADASGCVRIRGREYADVIAAAHAYADAEAEVLEALRQGEPMSSAYRHKKAAVNALLSSPRSDPVIDTWSHT